MGHLTSRSGRKAAHDAQVRRTGRLAPLLHILCACALLFVASVHKAPSVRLAAAGGIDSTQYALPDGTLPVICLSNADDGGDAGAGTISTGCEACRLTALPDAPVAPLLYRPAEYRIVARPKRAETALVSPLLFYRTPPRAPPVSDIHA